MKSRSDLTLQLNDLILNPSSLVRLETNIYHVALHPSSLSDLKSAGKDNLDSLLYKFNSNTVNLDDEALPETKKNKKLKVKELQEDSFAVSESQLKEFSNRIAKWKRETDNESRPKKKKKKKRKH